MLQALITRLCDGHALGDTALVQRLRLLLLDTAAISIASLDQPPLLELQQQRARVDSGLVQLPGMRHGLNPAATASVLATSACWDELVGGDARSHGRPGLGVVPVVLALSFAQRDSLERSLLALMLGYEVAATIGRAYQVPEGEHVDGSWQTAGAAVAAAALLSNDPAVITEAASLATCQMSRTLMSTVHEGKSGRSLYAAQAVERGIALANAACAGFQGPNDPFAAKPLEGLIERSNLRSNQSAAAFDAYVKFLPGARHMHYAVAAVQTWQKQHQVWNGKLEQQAKIQLRIYPEAIRYCNQPKPKNRIQAQFSLQFAVASTLIHGSLQNQCFAQEQLESPRLQTLMQAIALESDSKPQGRWAEIVISTPSDGDRSALIKEVEGDHIDAETEGHLLDHRQQLMEPVLGVEKAKALIQHWWTAPLTEQLLPPQLWI